MIEISSGAPSLSWITLSKATPAITPGIVPTIRAHAMRSSVVRIERRFTEPPHAIR